jgi:hypothetical protein
MLAYYISSCVGYLFTGQKSNSLLKQFEFWGKTQAGLKSIVTNETLSVEALADLTREILAFLQMFANCGGVQPQVIRTAKTHVQQILVKRVVHLSNLQLIMSWELGYYKLASSSYRVAMGGHEWQLNVNKCEFPYIHKNNFKKRTTFLTVNWLSQVML